MSSRNHCKGKHWNNTNESWNQNIEKWKKNIMSKVQGVWRFFANSRRTTYYTMEALEWFHEAHNNDQKVIAIIKE